MAKNSKSKAIMDEALGTINSALTILEKLPQTDDTNFTLSTEVNPISFIMKALYQTVGYDKVMDFTANMLTGAIDAIETAVKTYMLTQLKLMFTCTINPFITYDLLKNGVVFDLKTIDIAKILAHCPLDKDEFNTGRNGKWYYFGCDDFDYPDQLESSQDFNAVLWYVKNRTINGRSVWYGYKKQGNARERESLMQKQTRDDGILTLEYSGRSTGLKDAEGNGMYLQTPYNNCIHVFIGNTKALTNIHLNEMDNSVVKVKELQSMFNSLKNEVAAIKTTLQSMMLSIESNGLSREETEQERSVYKAYISYLDTILHAIDNNIPFSTALQNMETQGLIVTDTEDAVRRIHIEPTGDELIIPSIIYNKTTESLVDNKRQIYNDITNSGILDIYRPVELNYYYKKTLLQFNIDYIFSLKMFDSKTLAAQLIDALSGCLSVGLNLSIEEQMIRNEVNRMVHDLVDSDDTVISDCFFSFDNDVYNEMLGRSELQRIGLYVSSDGAVGGAVDVESVMAALNSLAPNATKEEIRTAISSSLFQLSKYITPEYNDGTNSEINYNLQANFINNLLQSLANVIVMSVLSPKLYLLMAVNLKIMGRESNFDLATFLDMFRDMIAGIIRTIRDELIRMFTEWLMSVIGEIAKEVGEQLLIEQIAYYRRLLQRCIECFRLHRGEIGWNMADVNYADIYDNPNNEEPSNEEC